jgi:hypothetical protein
MAHIAIAVPNLRVLVVLCMRLPFARKTGTIRRCAHEGKGWVHRVEVSPAGPFPANLRDRSIAEDGLAAVAGAIPPEDTGGDGPMVDHDRLDLPAAEHHAGLMGEGVTDR